MNRTWTILCAALFVATLGAGASRASENVVAPAADSAAGPSAPDIGHAEEVEAQLRHIKEALSDTTAFAALEHEIVALKHRVADRWIETSDLLKTKPRHLTLYSLAGTWETLRTEIEDVSQRIDARARQRAADLESLAKLHESWTRSLDLARTNNAPAFVLDRTQETIAAIDATRPLVERRSAQVLALQQEVGRASEACNDALARIDDAHREAMERILHDRQPALWDADNPLLGARVGWFVAADVAAEIEGLRTYVRIHWVGFVLSVGFGLALFALLRRARGKLDGAASNDTFLASATNVFRTPCSAATLVAIVLSIPLRPNSPLTLQYLVLALAMVAAVLVLRPFAGASLRRGIWGLAALYLVDLGIEVLSLAPALEQVLLIVERSATTAVLFWVASQLRRDDMLGSRWPRVHTSGATILRALALVCAVSVVASAAGYVDLADLLGGGALFLVYLALTLVGFRTAADGVVALALVSGPLSRLRTVTLYRATTERWIARLLDLFVVVIWVASALRRLELLEPARAVLEGLLDATLHAGALDLSVRQVLDFVAVVIGSGLAARLIVFLLEEDVYSRMSLPRGIPYALSTLTRYGILLAGFLVALATLGLDLTRLTVLVSAFGVGLGFGLQQVVNNFVSGLILVFERPVQLGDDVQLGTLSGEVTRIGVRSSTVRTPEGAEVIVPNSNMIEQTVTNWTLSDRTRRVELPLGAAYGVDAARVLGVLLEVAAREPRIVAHPSPEALFMGFGEKALQFVLRFWTEDPNWMRVRSDLGVALQAALRTAGIDTPKT